MTLPYEEKVAINNTRVFLTKLLFPKLSPGVSKAIRKEARRNLRHYPAAYQVDTIFNHYFDSKDILCPQYFLDRYRDLAEEYNSLETETIWNELDRKALEARKRRAFGKLTKKKVGKAIKKFNKKYGRVCKQSARRKL